MGGKRRVGTSWIWAWGRRAVTAPAEKAVCSASGLQAVCGRWLFSKRVCCCHEIGFFMTQYEDKRIYLIFFNFRAEKHFYLLRWVHWVYLTVWGWNGWNSFVQCSVMDSQREISEKTNKKVAMSCLPQVLTVHLNHPFPASQAVTYSNAVNC